MLRNRDSFLEKTFFLARSFWKVLAFFILLKGFFWGTPFFFFFFFAYILYSLSKLYIQGLFRYFFFILNGVSFTG